MEYRYLGNTGLLISVIGFGNMINYKPEDDETNIAIIKKAYELGINFFDTAEIYAHGLAEEALGRAIIKLQLPREKLVIATKLFHRNDETGLRSKIMIGGNPINRSRTLSRKHIIEGVDLSLKRLQLSYVDVIFAHQQDANTPIEEICRGFNQVIEDGKAFYWATSNWTNVLIQEAINICDRYGLHRPIADQCQYNLTERKVMEVDFAHLFDKYKYGTTIWSPLAGGILTGKYNDHIIPEDSRVHNGVGWAPKALTAARYNKILDNETIMTALRGMGDIAKEIGGNQSQLAIAWTIRNKDVSTAIIGARTVAQLEDSVKAIELVKKFTPEIDEKIETLFNNRPVHNIDTRTFRPFANRR